MPVEQLKNPLGSAGAERSQYVTFYVGREKYAVPVSEVREIVKTSSTTRIPLAPDYIEGLANLRGEVLPIINLRKRLGITEETTHAGRVVVINRGGKLIGLLVDRTAQVIEVSSADFKESETRSDFVESIIEKSDEFFLVLNLSKVTELAQGSEVKESKFSGASGIGAEADKRSVAKNFVQLVTFDISNQTYAFHIEHVQEIIRYKTPVQLPGVPVHVRGVIKLREMVLPVVDLKRLLFGEDASTSELTKVVVSKIGDALVGFVIDRINEVLKVERDKILPPPTVRSGGEEVSGVVNLGERMIMVLEPTKLLDFDVGELFETSGAEEVRHAVVEEEIQFVVFRVAQTHFAVPIEEVQEINRLSKVTRMPNAPDYVEGLMNLRGEVLPVVNLRRRFGMIDDGTVSSEARRVLVHETKNGRKVAYIVDQVEGVERFARSLIADASEIWSDRSGVITRVIKHPERTILVLDLSEILSAKEFDRLTTCVAGASSDKSLDTAEKSQGDAGVVDETMNSGVDIRPEAKDEKAKQGAKKLKRAK